MVARALPMALQSAKLRLIRAKYQRALPKPNHTESHKQAGSHYEEEGWLVRVWSSWPHSLRRRNISSDYIPGFLREVLTIPFSAKVVRAWR